MWAPQEPARAREAPKQAHREPGPNGECRECGMHPAHDWGRCRRCGNLVRAVESLRRENPRALEDLLARAAHRLEL